MVVVKYLSQKKKVPTEKETTTTSGDFAIIIAENTRVPSGIRLHLRPEPLTVKGAETRRARRVVSLSTRRTFLAVLLEGWRLLQFI